jgi:hypothetical protein
LKYLRGGLIVATACLMVAPVAGAVVMRTRTGHRVSLMLRPGARSRVHDPSAPAHAAKGSAPGAVLLYHGGSVLHGEKPYLIFWEPGEAGPPGSPHTIPGSSKTVVTQYLTDVADDSGTSGNVYGVLTQYADTTGFGASYQQTFGDGQVIDDTQAYPANTGGCPLAAGMSACVTDAQLQAEIGRVIATAHLGVGAGANAPIYFIVTPQDVNVCLGGGSCAANKFCAYHGFFASGGVPVLYASVPFAVWATNPTKGCQNDGTSAYQSPGGTFHGDHGYQIADNLSHELSETITDPLINAWFSKGSGLEVGDLCEAFGAANTNRGLSPNAYLPILTGSAAAGNLTDQLIHSDYYYTQTEWSNAAGNCLA